MGSGTPPVQILPAGAQNDQMCSTPLKIIGRPPTAQNGGSRGVIVTLGELIRLAARARRMLSFLLSYRAAPAPRHPAQR
jgi:hypothetical protein